MDARARLAGAADPGALGGHRGPAGGASDAFEDRGEALAAADAHRLQAVAGLAAVHLAGEGRQDAGAVAPTGWPSEMPDPLTLTRSQSPSARPHSRPTARTCAANASFSSMRSMSARVSPAAASALAVAGTGPMPIVRGGTPARPHETSRTSGRSPSSAARSGVVTTHAAAASFCPLAFPAVTVASGSPLPRTGRSRASPSMDVSGRGCSSVSTTVSPLRPLTVTGTSSSANRPSRWAATARACDRTDSSSCSSRPILYSRRRFSAVSSIPPGTGWLMPPAVTRPWARASCRSMDGPRTPQRAFVV
ncbi:hypothetical protein BJF79_03195 [Actinomadura sp. CNU-125]|nr:hypothetical protein BJF79_03195 [Actinomadura sp. CNU-125]